MVVGPPEEPVGAGVDEDVPYVVAATVQGEDEPLRRAVVFLPPPDVRDGLVLVLVLKVVEVVIRHSDGKTILPRSVRQPTRYGPRPQDAVLFQPQVEMRPRSTMVMQHKSRSPRWLRMLRFHDNHDFRSSRTARA